jgi:hypothetical protein
VPALDVGAHGAVVDEEAAGEGVQVGGAVGCVAGLGLRSGLGLLRRSDHWST